MSKFKKKIRKEKGFGEGKKVEKDLLALALQCIAQCQWLEAIELFKLFEQRSKEPKAQRVKKLLNASVNAAMIDNFNDALPLHCQLLGAAPNHPHGLRNFAVVLRRLQHYGSAKLFIDKYLELNPKCTTGMNTLGTILNDLGQREAAMEVFTKILEIDPEHANANSNLAIQYHYLAKIDLAFIHSSRAVAANSLQADLLIDHFVQIGRVCDLDRREKVDWWAVLEQMPVSMISATLLQILTICESETDHLKFKRIVGKWGQHKALQATQQPLPIPDDCLIPAQQMKIGFISADFRDHSVARFIWPLFQHLEQDEFSLFCYSTFYRQDSWRKYFEEKATAIRDVAALSPQELCNVVRDDGIHVLFDLTGFTSNSRIGALAWRAAPIQVSWLGFPGTSGLPQMDYLFLDRYLAPKDPGLIHEKSLFTKGTTICFSGLPEIPVTSTLPELRRGCLTMGTLNNSYKITRGTLKRWSSVLQKLPTAQFLFVRREFDSYLLRKNILDEFARLGINENRIHFYDNDSDGRHYLDCYNEIDISLDTFPVTGGTTTTDALWMGVPVVTIEGSNIHQRVCSSILRHAGYPEWIAQTDEEFVDIALNLANNQKSRINLRQNLRINLKNSLVCDTLQFSNDFKDCMSNLRDEFNSRVK